MDIFFSHKILEKISMRSIYETTGIYGASWKKARKGKTSKMSDFFIHMSATIHISVVKIVFKSKRLANKYFGNENKWVCKWSDIDIVVDVGLLDVLCWYLSNGLELTLVLYHRISFRADVPNHYALILEWWWVLCIRLISQ